MSEPLSEKQREQRRRAARASAEARRRNAAGKARPQPSTQQRLERHRFRQETNPEYNARTSGVVESKRYASTLALGGAGLGIAGGLGLGILASPPSGEFFPLNAAHNKSILTRTIRAGMTGAGNLTGRALGNITGETFELGRKLSHRAGLHRRANPFEISRFSDGGSRVGSALGRGGYNVYASVKSIGTNLLHAGTGRRRFITGSILGAPLALAGAPVLYSAGRRVGEHIDPYFPQHVRKNMSLTRHPYVLKKALDHATLVSFTKARPAGRPLSEEEREQRRNAARASAEARRRNAANNAGVDVSQINSRGEVRQRAYTPRARNEHGGFRSYSDDEFERLQRQRAESRYLRAQMAEDDIRFDANNGQLRTGTGQYRRSSRTRTDRAIDRTLAEAIAPGYGRHATKVIGAVRESFSMRDPEAKYGTIGAGLGIAAGGLLSMSDVQQGVREGADRLYRRIGLPAVSYARAGMQRIGLVSGGGDRAKQLLNTVSAFDRSSWPLRRIGAGAVKGFGSAAFLAPVVGSIGWGIGSSIGRSFKDADRRRMMRDMEYREMLARQGVTGG